LWEANPFADRAVLVEVGERIRLPRPSFTISRVFSPGGPFMEHARFALGSADSGGKKSWNFFALENSTRVLGSDALLADV
jgi:hypothetical protein